MNVVGYAPTTSYFINEHSSTSPVRVNGRVFVYKLSAEAAVQRFSEEKVFWKYAANAQENTHGEVWEHTCRNRTLACVFPCTYASYFQNTFSLTVSVSGCVIEYHCNHWCTSQFTRVSKYGVFSVLYFPVFGLNTDI